MPVGTVRSRISRGRLAIMRALAGVGVVASSLPSAQLLGGRLCSIDGRKVQLLFYEQGSRRLSPYSSNGRAMAGECRGDGLHHVCSREAAGLTDAGRRRPRGRDPFAPGEREVGAAASTGTHAAARPTHETPNPKAAPRDPQRYQAALRCHRRRAPHRGAGHRGVPPAPGAPAPDLRHARGPDRDFLPPACRPR